MSESSAAGKLVIDALSAQVVEKRRRVEALGLMNANVDEAARMARGIQYAQARSDLWAAQDALQAAVLKYGNS